MANIKKNALANIVFPMVDATDFATIESTITASDFNSGATKKFYGVNHGGSAAFTSGSISKATTLVHSGIFQQTLKAAETNYDYLVYRFAKTGCADQILVFQTVTNDDGDIYDLVSDVDSQVLLNASMISDIDSQLTIETSRLSDILDLVSDVDSQVLLNASMISDYGSAAVSQFSDLHSQASDLNSVLVTYHSDMISTISDLDSQVGKNASYLVGISGALSDVDSQLTVNYDLISDVDSQLTIETSRLSDILDLVSDVDSQLLLNASMISDVDSQLTVNYNLISDVDSQVLLNASVISDIDSQLTVESSRLSDIYSLLSDVGSDIGVMSDIQSDIYSNLTAGVSVGASSISDISSNLLTVAMTESYAADGAAPTLTQAIFAIQQFLQERAVSSTTVTVKKLDGSTGAMTFTLDDATTPTTITRAT